MIVVRNGLMKSDSWKFLKGKILIPNEIEKTWVLETWTCHQHIALYFTLWKKYLSFEFWVGLTCSQHCEKTLKIITWVQRHHLHQNFAYHSRKVNPEYGSNKLWCYQTKHPYLKSDISSNCVSSATRANRSDCSLSWGDKIIYSTTFRNA